MHFKSIITFACLFLFFACNSSKERPALKELPIERVAPQVDNWDGFWKTFTASVNQNDVEKVVDLTRWPLFTNREENGFSKQRLEGNFNKIFDKNAKSTFSNLTDRDIQIVPSNKETAGYMNTPEGIELKSINVTFMENEGISQETESTKTFVFGEIDGAYKLLALMYAN